MYTKTLFALSLILTCAFGLKTQAQTTAALNAAEISLDKEMHDYGIVQQHGDGDCFFTITNTGTADLTISKARGSCGCTVPDWPREPIKPGESAKMKVHYKTERVGLINKSVTIYSNSANSPTKIVRIKGEVKAPDTTATPIKDPTAPVVK